MKEVTAAIMANGARLRSQVRDLVERYDVGIRYSEDQASTRRHLVHQPGLICQLVAILGAPSAGAGRGGTTKATPKPDSRPSGWRSDVSDLLDDIERGVADRRRRAALEQQRASLQQPVDLVTALRELPDMPMRHQLLKTPCSRQLAT